MKDFRLVPHVAAKVVDGEAYVVMYDRRTLPEAFAIMESWANNPDLSFGRSDLEEMAAKAIDTVKKEKGIST